MPADPLFAQFESHQELLLPHTAAHLGLRNIDVGCGSGVASVIHTARLGLSPTLSDVIDIRHPLARALPFRLINAGLAGTKRSKVHAKLNRNRQVEINDDFLGGQLANSKTGWMSC